MNDSEFVDEARHWLRFATEDLDVAQRLLTVDEAPPRHACALAQQAAEKALKAALVLEGIDFPFRHDLDALRNLLPDTWSVRRTHTDRVSVGALSSTGRSWTNALDGSARRWGANYPRRVPAACGPSPGVQPN